MNRAASPADPRSFLTALGSRPNPLAVQAAESMLSHLDLDLFSRLSSLSQSPHRAKEECNIREEVEKAKLPYKSIVSLHELHQIYEGLISNRDERSSKTLEFLTSLTERSHVKPGPGGHDVSNSLQLDAAVHLEGTKMDFSGLLLHTLPSSFGSKFIQLVSLDLSKNELRDLPSSIGDLENLEILDVQSNQLSSLPDAIGCLHHLRVLMVSGNMLKDLPESLAGCRNLMKLDAGFNQLECIPAMIGYKLCRLETLCLHLNKITYFSPSLCELSHLKVLDLHFNNIKTMPASLGNMSSLEKLNMSNNFSDFGGMLPESIGNLDRLTELDVSFNQIRVLPAAVGALENLKVLKVDHNPLVIPPANIVDHSMEALLGYMSARWKASQTTREEETCVTTVGSLMIGCQSPLTGASLFHRLLDICSRRNAASRTLYHKLLDQYRHH